MLASVLTGHVCRMPLRGLSRSLSMPLFIQCHCAQTTLLLWNISQQVCYKLQNLQIHSSPCLFAPFVFASMFISLFTLSYCHVNFLSACLCLALSHLISPPRPTFVKYSILFLIYSDSFAFAVYLGVSIISFARSNPHIFVLWVLHRR